MILNLSFYELRFLFHSKKLKLETCRDKSQLSSYMEGDDLEFSMF